MQAVRNMGCMDMRIELTLAAGMVAIMALAGATRAHAAFPTYYADQGAFLAAGTILQTIDFDSYGPDLTMLSADETFGALTLSGDPLIVVGTDSYLQPVRNVIANNEINNALVGDIGLTGFNMLSFQIGNLDGFGEQAFVELFTNLDSYAYGLYPGPAPENLTFYGFVVPLGEYFTGFSMHATNVNQNFESTPIDQALAITDIRLGTTGQVCDTRVCNGGGGTVPEPSTWAMLILGFGFTGAMVRHRRPVLRTA